ncbi:hypothetical protein GCM10022225_29700 [Plantactinospora mayteni]|uniref:Uncharacterized protein n=1 Tax=Plantactinospora mayteni TaxID=566021 RepID=A0ABQ4ESZ2_9ACTN|nr:hypothetical protein [Plantactinospora mayteni]GIG97766.1 hypothetical protein Pma05_43390 [Plantactinospora mayteni]
MTTYRSRASVEADAAHQVLAAHVPDRETGVCPICLVAGPCQPANVAANRLVELGLPVLPPVVPHTGRGRLLAYVGPVLRVAPLLTVGWRRRLGLVDGDGGR